MILPTTIQGHRFARNGLPVDPLLLTATAASVVAVVKDHGKEYFRSSGLLNATNVTATQFRFACHSSSYTGSINVGVHFLIQRPATVGAFGDKVICELRNSAGVLQGSASVNVGTTPQNKIDSFNEILSVYKIISSIPADTDLFGAFVSINCKLLAVEVFEEGPSTGLVAIQVYQNGTPILDSHRQAFVDLTNKLTRRGGAQIFNWCMPTDTTARTIASATDTNLFDNTSTAITSSTPGYIVDLTKRSRRRIDNGVRCTFAHYGSSTTSNGVVKLLKENGSLIASIAVNGSTNAWRTVTATINASDEKLTVMHAATTGTTSSYAVSLFTHGV